MAAHHDRPSHDVSNAVDLTGRDVVVAIDFRRARIYAIDAAAGTRPEQVTTADHRHLNHNVFHHHGNPDGAFDVDHAETAEYLRTLAHALKPVRNILLLGHGGGKANFSHVLEAYLEKHHRDIAHRVVGSVRADIDDITDPQLVRLGESFFGIHEPLRKVNPATPTG